MNEKRAEFCQEIANKLELYYSLQDNDSSKKRSLGDYIDGFAEAGILLRYLTREEFLEIADQLHQSIHGISLQEQNLNNKVGFAKNDRDWKKYDEPTYARKNDSQ